MRYPVHSEDSGGNANCEHQIYNCYIEHYGNAGARTWRNNNAGSGMLASTVWSSEHAWGYGSSSGLVEKFENTELISPVNGFYVHTNKDFLRPNINEFKNCSIVKKGNFGTAIVVQSLGSGMSDILSLTNSEISGGFIAQSDLPWISQDFSRQIANKAETKIFASGCSNFGYRDQTRGRTIRITSNSTGTLSSVSLTGNA
ncbi:hypothetical protein, partial [Emticicia sp. W12TSBA100-4]|uniref:hypothetical protein n=1 Tax=Emticicia sp. W12TSBA100-4 TaxID=3160965 RepID=UPI0033065D5D